MKFDDKFRNLIVIFTRDVLHPQPSWWSEGWKRLVQMRISSWQEAKRQPIFTLLQLHWSRQSITKLSKQSSFSHSINTGKSLDQRKADWKGTWWSCQSQLRPPEEHDHHQVWKNWCDWECHSQSPVFGSAPPSGPLEQSCVPQCPQGAVWWGRSLSGVGCCLCSAGQFGPQDHPDASSFSSWIFSLTPCSTAFSSVCSAAPSYIWSIADFAEANRYSQNSTPET